MSLTLKNRAVIVGNGSSVDAMPPEFWDQSHVSFIGTNRVLVARALSHVRWDALVIRDSYRELWVNQDHGWHYHRDHWKPATAYKVGPFEDKCTHCNEYVRQVDGWQGEDKRDEDGNRLTMLNTSVVIMAINWAWLMGCREFCLVGVDYCGSHFEMEGKYQIEPRRGQLCYEKRVPERIEKEFREVHSAIYQDGGLIWNSSPGSKLRAITPMAWRGEVR